MLAMNVILDGDRVWPDLVKKRVVEVKRPISVAGLVGGLESGKPSVTIRLDVGNGVVVLAQTSLSLFLQAADLLKLHYGDPRDETI